MAEVRFKARAKRAISQTIRNGVARFGQVSGNNMKRRVEHCAKLIASHPLMGKVEQELTGNGYEYRSFVVHEYFKMIYRWDRMKDIIYVVHFWDVRQEPQRLVGEVEMEDV